MPTITIDERMIEVPQGTTVIQAAEQLGIPIPHYCYHAGLSIAGSCRMCLVEVEKAPKLQIACYTMVTDGMVVRTTTQQVTSARQAILEFLLSHHPLDCPVCDQAGECKLQEFYMDYGRYDSAVLEDKRKKHKAVPIGPHIMLDSERCILCSRCTRFVDEITKTHELGIFERGAHSELLPVNGRSVDNAYSGCLADICPVGALTDRDFRFKVRVWYLDKTDSICHGCARGCNISIHANRRRTHHNDGRLLARYKPRFNPSVNGHWMCDTGRYSYQRIEAEDRLLFPHVRSADGLASLVGWSTSLPQVDEDVSRCVTNNGVGSVAVIATPTLSNEELWAVNRVFGEGMKAGTMASRCPPDPNGIDDDLLKRADTFPNSFGAGKILNHAGDVAAALDAVDAGRIRTLIIIGGGLPERFGEDLLREKLEKVDLLVVIQTHQSVLTELAAVSLPMAAYPETDGTICNFEGQVQRYWAAIPPSGDCRPLLDILADLANRWEVRTAPRDAELCFAELAAGVEYFGGITYDTLGDCGFNPSQTAALAAAGE